MEKEPKRTPPDQRPSTTFDHSSEGPLHTCSVYGNKDVGQRLNEMMKMGLSKPWPEAMRALTGETRMDASAIVDYYQPLLDWLKEQNKDATCGW